MMKQFTSSCTSSRTSSRFWALLPLVMLALVTPQNSGCAAVPEVVPDAVPDAVPDVGPGVRLTRVPNGGLQPQVVARGETVHLIYFKGEAKAGDVFYVRSNDGGVTWAPPLRVNSQEGSAIAMGTIRGPMLAVGRKGRVYVSWNGSDQAMPRNLAAPPAERKYGAAPLLFSRLDTATQTFEPQRNVLTQTFNLDGGAAVAADEEGRVYLAYHANQGQDQDETKRCVFLTTSTDDGATFSPEKPVWNQPTGACGCCQVRLEARNGGGVELLYRSATEMVHRDSYFLSSDNGGQSFRGQKLHEWNINACPMSSFSLALHGKTRLAAWESSEKVYFSPLDTTGKATLITSAPESGSETGKNRKYPVLSVSRDGKTLLVWTQGTAWNRGGALLWQAYDSKLRPITREHGERDGLPAWSFAAAFARPDGGFTILY